VARHEGPAQTETGRQAFREFLGARLDAIVCTNNFLGQGVIEAIAEEGTRFVIGCFDEIPAMHLLPVPMVCAVQDIPGLAEGCVQLLLPQLRQEAAPPRPVALPAKLMKNPAFESLEQSVAIGHTGTRQ
jgi:DNA-binding LacI/PurR family transcriptional regulator